MTRKQIESYKEESGMNLLDRSNSKNLSVLSFNPGHDGAVAYVRGNALVFGIEAEKDSCPRHAYASAELLLRAMNIIGEFPDVIAISGWDRDQLRGDHAGSGYHGVDDRLATLSQYELMGSKTVLFKSTHERSHLFCSYGLSPFEAGQPCYALLWEGQIGRFYEIDSDLNITPYPPVLSAPGYKYSFLYDLADPTRHAGGWRHENAGKLMALSAYSNCETLPSHEVEETIRLIVGRVDPPHSPKEPFSSLAYHNCGVTAPHFADLVKHFSNELFELFHAFARLHLRKGYPLLISGGCGLNCEWNSRWRDCGLFRDVFVPPVTNDSGSAIGTAVEAQWKTSGCAKIDWDVYSGLDFTWDERPSGYESERLDYTKVATLLKRGAVIAWVQGRYELGPRALGNRSLLAAPFEVETTNRLNRIKKREYYRPVAPVCLEEDLQECFGSGTPSPHMLYFFKTTAPRLKAVTHVDGSARVQSVRPEQNARLYQLLSAFKGVTGFGVLCNTSLNFPGKGFINKSSDLFRFAALESLDAIVVGDDVFIPRP